MKYKLILLFVFSIFINNVFSQQKVFSDDSTLFITELSIYFSSVSKSQESESKKVLNEFLNSWNNNVMPDNVKHSVYKTCLLFDRYNLYAYPYYVKYLDLINTFTNKNFSFKNLEVFHKSVEYCLNLQNYNTQLSDYINKIATFIKHDAFVKTNSEVWKIKNADYEFILDSVPAIKFSNLDLLCVVRNDSLNIFSTSGVYHPLSLQWIGKNGEINWARYYFPTDTVYAVLKDYNINLQFTGLTAENVDFYHKGYFKDKLVGRLEERAIIDASPTTSHFPKFYLDKHIKVFMKLFPQIEYIGSFSMEGERVIGTPVNEDFAHMILYKDEKPFIKINSTLFLIRPSRFTTDKASVTVFLENDSIFHPENSIRYDRNLNQIVFERTNQGLGSGPYFNTYHKLDITTEAMYWNLKTDTITFESIKGIRSESVAKFVSSDYFSQLDYDILQGIDDVNPAELVSLFVRRNNLKQFSLERYTEWAKKPKEQLNRQLILLANKGLIEYDVERNEAFVKSRLFEFLATQKGVKDSDILSFESKLGNQTNAILDLKDMNMYIAGVSRIMLSDSQYVYVVPKDGNIVMQKNRDFSFSGRVHAGLFDIETSEAVFNYDKFSISMPEISKVSMIALEWTPNALGQRGFVPVTNYLTKLNADLYIDDPDSKSGRKMLRDYPVIVSKDTSFVYYDRNDIVDGAYNSEDFYFQIFPFTMDSLNSIPTPHVNFKGQLVSAGIFPIINESLKIQKDYSLGFMHIINQPGLPVYGGKGNFTDTLMLSNSGLIGKGALSYLTSDNKSSNFLFKPNEATAKVENYNLKQFVGSAEYPDAIAKDASIIWNTDKNEMEVSSGQEEGFSMFEGSAKLDGVLLVSPEGLSGKGKFSFEHAEVVSNKYSFKSNSFVSDTADFKLISPFDKTDALRVHVFRTDINFDSRIGHFVATGDGALMEFPKIQYNCVVNEFDWLMDENKLALINKTKFSKEEYYSFSHDQLIKFNPGKEVYYSTSYEKKNLTFFALNALYDLNLDNLQVSDVRIIKVADAAIFPKNAKMIIGSNGEIETLKDAQILADTVNQNYLFYNATTNIDSRLKYRAQGFYDYKPVNGSSYVLLMDSITVAKNRTVANSFVSDSSNFKINDNFAYQGNISIFAELDSLNFQGAFSVVQNCYPNNNWVKINQKINPRSVQIKIPLDLENISNQKLRSSIYHSLTEHKPMYGFFETTENVQDQDIFAAKGFIKYDLNTQEYVIADTSVLNNYSNTGNILKYNTVRCFLQGDGDITLANDLGLFNMKNYGKIQYYIDVDSTVVNTAMVFDFHFKNEALDIMSNQLNDQVLQAIDVNTDNYKKSIRNIAGKEVADKFLEELSLYGKPLKFPAELNHSIVLTDVSLVYNKETRSYVCYGPIGVNSIGNKMVMKYVPGFIEIQKRRSGDIISIYLMLQDNQWYYFDYGTNILQAISTNESFNEQLVGLKAKDRRVSEEGKPTYQFIIGTQDKQASFYRKMRQMERVRENSL